MDSLVELPGVGENLHDHLLVSNLYEATRPLPEGANNLLEAQLYARSRHCEGPAPDLQPLFIHIPYPADGYPTPEHGYTIAAGLVAPRSRGTLPLASADPSAMPLADPNILADPADLEAMVEAVEMCREIGASSAFAPWRAAEVAPGPEAKTRAELFDFVRRSVGTYHHQVGTCKMGAADDPAAVVGADHRAGPQRLEPEDASRVVATECAQRICGREVLEATPSFVYTLRRWYSTVRGTDEQSASDVGVGKTVAGEPSYLGLLRRQFRGGVPDWARSRSRRRRAPRGRCVRRTRRTPSPRTVRRQCGGVREHPGGASACVAIRRRQGVRGRGRTGRACG